jgi:DNA-nicking Smr family endonuclease
MARPLSPDERALWKRVTEGIASDAKKPRPRAIEPRHDAPLPRARGREIGETLDAGWDRRLRLGEVEPDWTLDLHGLKLDAAHARLLHSLEGSVRAGHRLIVLVTGKAPPAGANRLDAPLRGIIRASVGDWLAASPLAPHIAAVRPAHRKHGGQGALYIVLRRTDRR